MSLITNNDFFKILNAFSKSFLFKTPLGWLSLCKPFLETKSFLLKQTKDSQLKHGYVECLSKKPQFFGYFEVITEQRILFWYFVTFSGKRVRAKCFITLPVSVNWYSVKYKILPIWKLIVD